MVYHQYRVDQSDIIYEDENGVTIREVEDDTASEDGDEETYDITKAYYEEYDDSGLETYIITSVFNEPEEYICELRELGYCEYAFENEDGMLEIKMTIEEKEAWIARTKENIDTVLESIDEDDLYKMEFIEKYDELRITVSKECNANEFMDDLIVLAFNAELYQVFNGSQEWSLHIVIENMDTGNELANVYFPQQSLNITPEMWDE